MHNLREYSRPQTIEEALRLLSRKDLRSTVLSSGAEVQEDTESVIDPAGLALAYIREHNSGLLFGGLTKLQEIVDSPVVAVFAGGKLADAALLAATSLLRNQVTLAETLLSSRSGPGLAALLLVLEAEVLIRRLEKSTTLPLADLYEDLKAGVDGALLSEVYIPAPPPGAQFHLRRLSRTPSDRALLTVAALTVATEGTIREVRLAVAGIGVRQRRLREMESKLTGRRMKAGDISTAIDRAISQVELPQDRISGNDYKRSMLQVLIRRAILGE